MGIQRIWMYRLFARDIEESGILHRLPQYQTLKEQARASSSAMTSCSSNLA